MKVAKNKFAPPFREVHPDLPLNHGIDVAGSLLDAALAVGMLTRNGSWIMYGTNQLGHGREAARDALTQDPTMAAGIERHAIRS